MFLPKQPNGLICQGGTLQVCYTCTLYWLQLDILVLLIQFSVMWLELYWSLTFPLLIMNQSKTIYSSYPRIISSLYYPFCFYLDYFFMGCMHMHMFRGVYLEVYTQFLHCLFFSSNFPLGSFLVQLCTHLQKCLVLKFLTGVIASKFI